MDYAILSGGDVGPLGSDAVSELHALFAWAEKSRRGLLVFIDEAEAFLSSRAGSGGGGEGSSAPSADDVHMRHALNALLYQTGTQSTTFMLVIATNRPQDLDSAVLDRMDMSILIDIPKLRERSQLVKLYMDIHVKAMTLKASKAQKCSVDEGMQYFYKYYV
jgi:ATPase family AAA domain-containing protein 3A/B